MRSAHLKFVLWFFSVKVLLEEKLADNAERLGKILRSELSKLPKEKVKLVRGRGLLNAIVINDSKPYY